MSRITDNFTWEEAAITSHRSIDNTIPPYMHPVIQNTAKHMEEVRVILGVPIVVSSWYRCPELNYLVGSRDSSQHPRGEAVDFIAPQFGSPLTVVKKLAQHRTLLRFDQLILEHSWVHISFVSLPGVQPRVEVLTLLKNRMYAHGITDKFGAAA